MFQLTVGYVSGLIAAGFFVARLWSPNALTFVLSGLLRDRSSAATWSVASRAFQRSLWPTVLRTDSVLRHGVRKDILLLTELISLMGALIAIAGVVTPLGLYDALLPADSIQTPFQYLKDNSPFGYGTPPRSNLSFSRICIPEEVFGVPKPCPFSDTVDIVTYYPNGTINYSYPYGIDVAIPNVILDTYSSGTDNTTTVSNFFDIQWRRYITTSSYLFNNGSSYLIGAFRNMQSLILNNATQPVEGLVVDTVSGGVGLRNHTIPPGFQYGVAWKEDLLFIEPETVCVDTNLTLDFTVVSENNTVISGVVLTDRGGFVNLNHTYPEPDFSNPQKNPDLFGRAYKAAWLSNVLTAFYYNVTNPNEHTAGIRSFSYLNSYINKTFKIPSDGTTSGFDALELTTTFGDYLTNSISNVANASNPSNPFGIGIQNFSDINILCTGAGNADFANITNILVSCGMMHGVPQRQDPGSNLIFDAGSQWSQNLYACASAVKATIKTVSFVYNGTEGLLSSLTITDIQDKVYPDNSSMPLWGVENTGNAYEMMDLNLIWGLVSNSYENNPNVSTVRQSSLYLPGWFNPALQGGPTLGDFENLPGSDFSVAALSTAYDVCTPGTCTSSVVVDYSGESNVAMWARWQNLTQSAETASLIPNLIWTDTAASAIVGTKGVLGPGNTAQQNLVPLLVTPTVSKIQYHYPFAIPALLTALMLVLISLIALATMCFSGAGIGRMRLHLQQLSPGRIYTTFLYPGSGGLTMGTKEWRTRYGKKVVDLSGEFPAAADVLLPLEKGASVTEQERWA